MTKGGGERRPLDSLSAGNQSTAGERRDSSKPSAGWSQELGSVTGLGQGKGPRLMCTASNWSICSVMKRRLTACGSAETPTREMTSSGVMTAGSGPAVLRRCMLMFIQAKRMRLCRLAAGSTARAGKRRGLGARAGGVTATAGKLSRFAPSELQARVTSDCLRDWDIACFQHALT